VRGATGHKRGMQSRRETFWWLRRSSGGKSRAADHVPSGVQQAQHNFRKRNAFWRFAKSKDEPDSRGEPVATGAR